jgi:multiple sugar transport system permease protein
MSEQFVIHRKKKILERQWVWAFIMLFPLGVGICLIYFSIFFGVGISLTNWDMLSAPNWTGLSNYKQVMVDDEFWKATRNTLFLVLYSIPLKIIGGFLLALLLNQALKGVRFFKLVFFFPTTCSLVAIAILWSYIYDNSGLLNSILHYFGLSHVYWLDESHVLGSVAIMTSWSRIGYIALLFLAGLQNIPTDYYESSWVDGANWGQQLWKITLPLLTPTTFFVLITELIGTFQIFNEAFTLQKIGAVHGPSDALLTVILHVYNKAFASFQMGYASAISYILVLIIFLITVIQLWLQRKWVHYDL